MTKVSLEPLFDRVIIKRDVKEKTDGGIILPDHITDRMTACVGEVIAIGPTADLTIRGGKDEETGKEYKSLMGASIMYGEFAGAKLSLKDSDENYFILKDTDILGVIRDE